MPLASLDPVPLNELAEHLRDGTWLDMRVVECGLLRRVRLFEIRVRFAEEELAAEQEYLENEGAGRVEHIVPRDAVRWARPTSFSLEDVPPPDRRTQEEKRQGAERAARAELVRKFEANPLWVAPPWQTNGSRSAWKVCERIFNNNPDVRDLRAAILAVVSAETAISVPEILHDASAAPTAARRWCIRMTWEMSRVSQSDIAYLFGYHSGGMAGNALGQTGSDPNATAKAKTFAGYVTDWLKRNRGITWTTRRTQIGRASRQKKLL